ncbi:uncharacterized protein EI90DRAFT_3052286 [Cantharellus anzutake]|uniref:uncharacterized protein n=1 Tax=Cantharellus anzutake TaxID=1750568 RepID=UPI0019032A0E|nr:uncharacterized protein EI90DRAFT_3052286 [Cantharellus anzutake]KAF8333527.1 hypothetical protein EI90DRAFT_3052286 [Cantharellus anzutake]
MVPNEVLIAIPACLAYARIVEACLVSSPQLRCGMFCSAQFIPHPQALEASCGHGYIDGTSTRLIIEDGIKSCAHISD